MARKRLVLRNTALFVDPANLSWERYVAMQARERERYLAEKATVSDDALNYRHVSPRHLEMDREVFERARIPEGDWLAAWESPGTTCRFFRHLLELEDSIEILVKGNFVAEGAAGPGTFTVLADGAETRGDVLSAVNHRARIRDETRHISYGRALVKALIEDDPSNLDTIQRWQDDSLRLFSEVARGGERQAWWEGFLASYYKIALPMGLRPTSF